LVGPSEEVQKMMLDEVQKMMLDGVVHGFEGVLF
jgi:hypothetical protein